MGDFLLCQQDFFSSRKDIQTRFDIIYSYHCEIAGIDCYLSKPDTDLLLISCAECEHTADPDQFQADGGLLL